MNSSFLRRFESTGEKGGAMQSAAVRRLPGGEALAEKFVRRGYLDAQEIAHRRKTRTQKIIAWNPAKDEPSTNPAEEKIREVLTATRGPLPLALLMKKAEVSRAIIQRLGKTGPPAHLGRAALDRRRSLGHKFHSAHQCFKCGTEAGSC